MRTEKKISSENDYAKRKWFEMKTKWLDIFILTLCWFCLFIRRMCPWVRRRNVSKNRFKKSKCCFLIYTIDRVSNEPLMTSVLWFIWRQHYLSASYFHINLANVSAHTACRTFVLVKTESGSKRKAILTGFNNHHPSWLIKRFLRKCWKMLQ